MVEIIILLVLVVLLVFQNWNLKKRISKLLKDIEQMEKLGKGLFEYNEHSEEVKKQNKEKIIETLDKSGSITNQQVQKLLHISDATVQRYMEDLEKDGRIIQSGKGRGVYYRSQ